jgi:hypothetical protein
MDDAVRRWFQRTKQAREDFKRGVRAERRELSPALRKARDAFQTERSLMTDAQFLRSIRIRPS